MSDEKVDRGEQSLVSTQRVRLLVALFAAVLLIGVCVVVLSLFRSCTQPTYVQIVDELPNSAQLVRHELIRHGIDYCRLFEFRCSDAALRDMLVNKWKLQDLTNSKEAPVSFVENDHPAWWTPTVPSATHSFGRRDEDTESYLSVWEQSETGRLYVEVGRW